MEQHCAGVIITPSAPSHSMQVSCAVVQCSASLTAWRVHLLPPASTARQGLAWFLGGV